ncbi:MAG: radical SAM protein [Thermoproteus sp. AZ2]|uniref:Radical SAM protein n=1 Tax=Thermoproteus sp. AZ2 TaxID=1609232 RepID=A0ACC6V3Q3_9CREN
MRLLEAYELKRRIAEELAGLLGEEVDEAKADPHAKRRPIACGITVHTGVGCPVGCAYCYIYSMGFPRSIKPYPLSPLQLAYALAVNPHVAVGEWGTLIATGSVTEPFLPSVASHSLSYLRAIAQYLGNPIQVSTKMRPPLELSEVQRGLDVLISVTDLSGRLEPGAPNPVERLEAGAELIRRGVSVTLFVRPIIPGVTDSEADKLLRAAYDLGYRRVVFGTLRVTPSIMARLKSFGVNVAPYVRGPLSERRQIPIKYPKGRLVEMAKTLGFQVLPASCSANITAHGQACALCNWGPCGDPKRLKVDVGDVGDFLAARGYRGEVEVRGLSVRVKVRGKLKEADRVFMEQALRVRVNDRA